MTELVLLAAGLLIALVVVVVLALRQRHKNNEYWCRAKCPKCGGRCTGRNGHLRMHWCNKNSSHRWY
jgi:hypothetical protein